MSSLNHLALVAWWPFHTFYRKRAFQKAWLSSPSRAFQSTSKFGVTFTTCFRLTSQAFSERTSARSSSSNRTEEAQLDRSTKQSILFCCPSPKNLKNHAGSHGRVRSLEANVIRARSSSSPSSSPLLAFTPYQRAFAVRVSTSARPPAEEEGGIARTGVTGVCGTSGLRPLNVYNTNYLPAASSTRWTR